MNKLFYLALALLFCSACGNKNEYVIEGCFPGLQDGMTATLRNVEGEEAILLASDTIRNGRFELRGQVASPTFCELTVSNSPLVNQKRDVKARKAWLFLDNSRLTLDVPHFDSIGYVSTLMPFAQERIGAVTGSPLQTEFNAYRKKMLPLELAAYQPYDTLSNLRFWHKHEYPKEMYDKIFAEFYPQQVEQQAIVDAARMEFIRQHPTSLLSLYIAEDLIKKEFTRTKEELEELSRVAEQITDTVRVPRFLKRMELAMKQYKSVKYADVELGTPAGTREKLSSHVRPGSYTLIDFWASWCGPCKAAIPSVKALYNTYNREQLNVVSISMDEKKADWEKAMKEENMPWAQLRCDDQKSYTEISKAYRVTSIPRLVLLDPQGRVVFSSFDADALQLTIHQLLGNN
ncbi:MULTISPECIES: TlpA disulfide reductase family protein [Butyricimonas]|uniref:TlpA disulfide reductase family protein n=1 Tax=Butyricimonas TaxID=574697 RepID=UPI0007FB236D|nr:MULTISPECIES: TlpA disulfide reductase family protein [Butyricimonas]